MASPSPLILALDCGSTNLKGALFDADLNRLAEAAVPVRYSRDQGPEVELPAEDLWDGFRQVARGACQAAGVTPRAITDVALDSQAQTFALLDTAGRPLTPFYSWLDRRAEAATAALTERLGERFHEHCSFAPPIPQLQLCKMRWLADHDPALVRQAAALVMLPGFIATRLGVPNTTDLNLAAMGGAGSLARGTWWAEALAAAGFRLDQMPRLVDVGAAVHATASPADAMFRDALRVTFAGNDQTAGAFGNACERGGMVVTLGTALVIYRHTGRAPGPYHAGACWGPYPGGSFYELSTIDEGCQALDWARQQILPGEPPSAIDAAAQGVVDSARQAAAPLFWPQRLRGPGAWSSESTETALRAYAVLEGIGFALRRLIEVTLQAAGQAAEIAVLGGGSRSAVWLGILADVLGTALTPGRGDALLGAAAMATGARLGPPAPAAGAAFRPDPVRQAALDRRYRRWLEQA